MLYFCILSLLLNVLLVPVYAKERVYIINVPNPCVKIERVEKNKVYLTSIKEHCIQVTGKLQVNMDTEYKSVYIYIDNTFWQEQTLQEFEFDTIRQRMDEKERLRNEEKKKNGEKGSVKTTENIHKKRGEEEAQKASNIYYSKDFQEKIHKEIERLKQTVFKEPLEAVSNYYKDINIGENIEAGLTDSERVYIFISSSVPVTTLRNYAADIDKAGSQNIIMVMRGMKGGLKYIKPTIEFINSIVKKDPNCNVSKEQCEFYNTGVQIDPLLFKRYNISKVPAVAYARGIDILDMQGSEGKPENAKVNDFYIIYGDVALDYALERINKEANSERLNSIIKKIRSGFYE